jgi:prepilin-type N-terminal cleavage/methylation domain-containing protein
VARVLIKTSALVFKIKDRSISYCNGFSLIEVLVALAILGGVLLVSLSCIIYQLKKEKENTEMIQAVEIAKSKMEEVLSLTEIKDSEEIINGKFLLRIKVLDGDKFDEPINLRPIEVRIAVHKLKEKKSLIELYSLK